MQIRVEIFPPHKPYFERHLLFSSDIQIWNCVPFWQSLMFGWDIHFKKYVQETNGKKIVMEVEGENTEGGRRGGRGWNGEGKERGAELEGKVHGAEKQKLQIGDIGLPPINNVILHKHKHVWTSCLLSDGKQIRPTTRISQSHHSLTESQHSIWLCTEQHNVISSHKKFTCMYCLLLLRILDNGLKMCGSGQYKHGPHLLYGTPAKCCTGMTVYAQLC